MCDNIYFKNEKRMCQTLKRLGREEMAIQMCRDITEGLIFATSMGAGL